MKTYTNSSRRNCIPQEKRLCRERRNLLQEYLGKWDAFHKWIGKCGPTFCWVWPFYLRQSNFITQLTLINSGLSESHIYFALIVIAHRKKFICIFWNRQCKFNLNASKIVRVFRKLLKCWKPELSASFKSHYNSVTFYFT